MPGSMLVLWGPAALRAFSSPALARATSRRQTYDGKRAIASLEKAISLDPNYANAYALLATVKTNSGHAEEALGHLEQAIRLNPGFPYWYIYEVGKAQFMELFRDRANQLGDAFVLKDFMDEFYASGFIPMSLIRWEITGYDDEIGELAPPKTTHYGFDGDFQDLFHDHPAWFSREAQIVQTTDGVASLTATGTGTSEAWKTWHEPMPYDRDWSIAVDVTVPRAWDTDPRPDAQVGAGPWLGRLDAEGKARRVYEVNLATIANEIRFVQGQLIENRLGEDPIAVGMAIVADETVRLEISYKAVPPTISLTANGTLVDTKTIDGSGADDWAMTGDDVFYGGIMGFAENSDLTKHPVTLDSFTVTVDR